MGILADLRYAVRVMRQNIAFTGMALAALALGIGANTAIFTVVDAVLLQPLPYAGADRMTRIGRLFPTGIGYSTSIPKFMAWRQNQVFDAMALYDFGALGMNLGSGDPPQVVKSLHVSAGYFAVFGVSPLMGRTFLTEEDIPNGPRVVVISHATWVSRFGSTADILDKPVVLNGVPHAVVGVLPPTFHADPDTDVWIPLQADSNSTNQGHYLNAAARLKAGVSVAAAQAQMKVVGEQFRAANPMWMDNNESVGVVSMREAISGDVRPALLVLTGAVALVLLIACANVANLLLARAAGRQRELAIRSAMGADRWRVGRQLLTESLLLAGGGGVLGWALGAWGVRALLLLVPVNMPRLTDASGAAVAVPALDWRVTTFTAAVSVLTGLVFGLFPAIQTSRLDLSSRLKEASGRSGTGLRHNRSRAVLVVTEIALALVLLVGAALLIRTFVGLRTLDTGIDAKQLLTLQTSLTGHGYATTASVDNLTRQVVARLEAVPGIQTAASAIVLPIEGGVDLPFAIVGRAPVRGNYNGDEQWRSVSARYFTVFGIPVLRGRVYSETDSAGSTKVVVINQAMATKYWPGEDPIGQVLVIGKGLGPQFEDAPRQIVGIVGNVRENGLRAEAVGVMYIPQSQMPEGMTQLANNVIPLSWAIRTKGEPLSSRLAVERELRAVDGQLPISRERTMEQVIVDGVSRQQFNMVLLSIFAGVALALAGIGIYGLMSYSVEQRTQEFGIRMALGADRKRMLGFVIGEGLKLATLGVVVGLALAYGLMRLLRSLLFGVNATDPAAFVLVAATLAIVALLASYLPARRATAVDPAVALRYG